ncbi:MAG TPA: hypothetical protein VG709_08160 [Actinomycetota bacterium]|nr:hypothetical protein [Actinomycetota bacterium]
MAGSPSAVGGGAGVRPAAVLAPLALAVASAATASVLVLIGQPLAAAMATAVAAGALIFGGIRAREAPASRLPFADAVAERAVDVAVLGGFAWAALPEDPAAAAAALTALVSSYLASYLRAKATGLGFAVDEPAFVRPLRLVLVVLALFRPENAAVALWAAAAVAAQSIVRGAALVARKREAP